MFDDSFEAVFTHATIGIIVCDEQGLIVAFNRHARTLFGYSEEEMKIISIDALVPDSVAGRHAQLRASFNADPQVRAMGHGRDLYAKRKDGSVFPAEISLSYFYRDNALLAVGYIIDITAKKEAEQTLLEQKSRIEQLNAELEQKVADRTHALMATLHQLEQSKDELAKALAAERELGELKSRFVSMASHEFRTPLSAVLTSASLIEKYPGADQQAQRLRHIHRIKSSVNHLNAILEEFLSVGRLEEGRVEATWSWVDLPKLIDEVVADLSDMLKPGQRIQTRFDGPQPVYSDPSLLRKILVNLLSNAIKYSSDNQVIDLARINLAGAFQLQIRDQGIGISTEDQKHLFERFFRAKNATNFAGTGLGLHIVAKYVELLDGSIELTSQLGEGTTVTITFPHEKHSAH
ncbi:ATP-binding protein [Spirosoma koreense]